VAIFDLEDVGYDAISSLAFDEVLSCYLKWKRIFWTKFVDEILIQGTSISFAHLITWNCVGHNFYDASYIELGSSSIWNGLIGENIEIKTTSFEYTLEHVNDLESQIILPNIIEDFEDTGFNFHGTDILLFQLDCGLLFDEFLLLLNFMQSILNRSFSLQWKLRLNGLFHYLAATLLTGGGQTLSELLIHNRPH